MAFTFYAAVIPSYLQILGSMSGLIDKAQAFCTETDIAPEDLLKACLADDMLPLAYQFKSTAGHSLGAIEGVRNGVYRPDMTPPPTNFEALRELTANTITTLKAIDPAEVDGFVGRDMRFEIGTFRIDFTAEDFLLSFSQPNFYFHATTAYDILRMKGVKIGKRDFMGELRKQA